MYHQQNAQGLTEISKTQKQELGSTRDEGNGKKYRYVKVASVVLSNVDTIIGSIMWFRAADLADGNFVVTTVTAEKSGLAPVGVSQVAVDLSAEAEVDGLDYIYYGWIQIEGIGYVSCNANVNVGDRIIPVAANHGVAVVAPNDATNQCAFAQSLVDNAGIDLCFIKV